MADEIFTDSEGHIIRTSSMKDEHQLVKIMEKKPNVQNIGKIVSGDTNSNIITFEINRFYDGVDLHDKNIRFIIKNSNGVFTEEAVNLQYSDTLLRFSWVLSYAVTQKSGLVTVAIQFYGINENGDNYSLKSLPFTINIEASLDATDITVEPPKNWFVDVENRITKLENENVTTDTTLTLSGIPADAKTVGDILKKVSNIDFETEAIDFEKEFV